MGESAEIVVVYVTTATDAEARAIAASVVNERLAACANILPPIRSIYWWQGAVEESVEVALLLKTRADLVPALSQRVRALHSYACPCIVALPVVGGNAAYLAWISSETTTKRSD